MMDKVLNIRIVVILISFLSIYGCTQEERLPTDFKYDYFPVEIGSYVTYELDSTIYDDFFVPPKKTVIKKQIRELIESEYIDNEGRPGVRIERYKRDSTDMPWQISDIWYATRTKDWAEKIEENKRYMKLVFPPKDNTGWKGNIFIETVDDLSYLSGWEYMYQDVDQPLSINNVAFDSTLTVVQFDDEDDNAIEKLFSVEKYAKGVGLIYKELIVVELEAPTVVNQDWRGREKNGFILKMEVIDFGKE